MSARALKKLQGPGDLQGELRKLGVLPDTISDEESEEASNLPNDSVSKDTRNKNGIQTNAYLLLEECEDDSENLSNHSDKESGSHESVKATVQKKKKKSKPKKGKTKTDQSEHGTSELETNANTDLQLGDVSPSGSVFSRTNLLLVDSKHLKPDNEMRRIFGSQVVLADRRRNMRGVSISKQMWLVQPNPHWAHLPKLGLSMDLLETSDGCLHFAFRHSKEYQKVQLQFLDAVDSYNPDNVIALLNANPAHVDSLLQLSDICRMGEDPQTAAELVERALYVLENAFHPSFNLGSGLCRLDYRRSENRSFFLALFKQLVTVGQKGCYRTSLELCKVLFNLSPEEDPLGVLLMIDFYALRAREYTWLLQFFAKFDNSRNLNQLPNWAFSVALAKCMLLQEGEKEISKRDKSKRGDQSDYMPTEQEADKALQDALIMFPGFLKPMVDKCNIQPDESVFRNDVFGPLAEYEQAQPLKLLIQLYIARNFSLWKQPVILPYLERNVTTALERVKAGDEYHKFCVEARKRRYIGTPRNVYRHVLISDFKEAASLIPAAISDGVLMFDPLPPKDSIPTYSTNRVRNITTSAADDSNLLSVFFRSLMPDYRPAADNRVELEVGVGDPNVNVEGAGANLRRSVATLIDSMRDLLNNMNRRNEDHDRDENQ